MPNKAITMRETKAMGENPDKEKNPVDVLSKIMFEIDVPMDPEELQKLREFCEQEVEVSDQITLVVVEDFKGEKV